MIVPSSVWPGGQPPFPIPSGLRPFPPDRGNRPLDKGSRPPGGRLKKKAANPRLSPKISAARLKIPGMAENERKTSQKN